MSMMEHRYRSKFCLRWGLAVWAAMHFGFAEASSYQFEVDRRMPDQELVRIRFMEAEITMKNGRIQGVLPNESIGSLTAMNLQFVNGDLWSVGGETDCGEHAQLWKFDFVSSDWMPIESWGQAPDGRIPHAIWSDGSVLHWLSIGETLVAYELDLVTMLWEIRFESIQGQWVPEREALVLEDFIAWNTQNQTLFLLQKDGFQLAHFPKDAWAGYLSQAQGAAYVRSLQPNVLELGSDLNRLNRYDFNEKARYADFAPIRGAALLAVSSMNDEAGLILPWFLLGLSWLGFGWYLVSRRRNNGSPAVRSKSEEFSSALSYPVTEFASIAHWSQPLRDLILSGRREFTTSELDELFAIHEISSPETLRAKRSRMILGVNTEFNLLFGYDLIRRKRDDIDRRKLLYTLASLPPNLAKSLQRNRMHQLHADNGSDGSDSVTQDSE